MHWKKVCIFLSCTLDDIMEIVSVRENAKKHPNYK